MKLLSEYSLRELLELRQRAIRGCKSQFTVAQINNEADRRHQNNLTIQQRMAAHTHQTLF